MKETMVNREFKVLREQITPENVLVMAELLTIKQTKTLIGYIGKDAITAHEKVYIDVMHKDEDGYVLSDYYDLVQDVALFLCKHFGKHLDDYFYTSKKNRAVTVKMECYYIIKRELYKRYSIGMKNCSLDAFRQMKDDRNFTETAQDEIEASYDRVEKIVSLMKLGEKHLIVLNGRMNGMENGDGISTCSQCGMMFNTNETRLKTFLIPDFGFVAEGSIKKPTLIKPERTYKTEASFVSYNNDMPEEKYFFNGYEVKVSTIDNGKLAMVTVDDFFVCDACGWAIEDKETKNPYVYKKNIEHNTPTGAACKCKNLNKYTLGYTFETDVIKISIEKIAEYEEAYSVLQAFVLAASTLLTIDNSEVGGTLQFDRSGYFSFILYDTTPGGAGHVRRLNSKTMIEKLLYVAYKKAAECTCGDSDGDTSCYNCLRTYKNQRYHDMIKRSYVIKYLSDIVISK